MSIEPFGAALRVSRHLRPSRTGAIAPVFVLMLPALLGAIGFSVDFGNWTIARNKMQIAADAAALAAVQGLGSPPQAGGAQPVITDVALAFVNSNLPAGFGEATRPSDVTVGRYTSEGGFVPGESATANAVRVAATLSPERNNPFRSIFGFDWSSTITVSATAAKPRASNYEPPQSINLDNEAGDYNEIYAYCYDFGGSGSPASWRSQMTLISNNASGIDIVAVSRGVIGVAPVENPPWPDCRGAGNSISLRLRNIRHAKSMSNLWANPNISPGRPEHDYFTDTRLSGGNEFYDGLTPVGQPPLAIVETIVCCTPEACRPARTGSNRTPEVATAQCEPGKFKYFGWEDRPPGQPGAKGNWTQPAWTDRDYDDIRIILKCPKEGRLGSAFARLVD